MQRILDMDEGSTTKRVLSAFQSSSVTHRIVRYGGAKRLLFLALVALLTLLTVMPLVTVLVSSLRPLGLPAGSEWTLHHYLEVWSSAYTYGLVGYTLVFAVGSTVFAIIVSLGLSWLLERTDLPGRKLFGSMIIMPMATPPLLLAIGWALILAPRIGFISTALQNIFGASPSWLNIYSMPGMIVVQGLAFVPTAVLVLSPVVRNMDPTYEEAAIAAGASPWQTMLRISLPFLMPAVLSTATILMIVGMLAFDVPAIIGLPGHIMVMSSEIYRLMNPPGGMPEYGSSAALNSSLFVLLMLGLLLYVRLTRNVDRFATISGKGYKANRFALGRWRPFATAAVAFYFILAVILPFIALIWTSLVPYFSGFDASLLSKLSLASYTDVLGSDRFWAAAQNSLFVAGSAAVGATLLSLAVSWTILRSKLQLAWLLDILVMIPVGIPHLMMGVALIFLFFSFRVIPLYGTVWLIALGHMILYLPIASRMMQAGLLQIGRELEEAALVARASVLENVRRIVIPLLRPTLIAVLIWVLVHSVREFSTAVMLQSGRNEVLSTILYSFWENGSSERTAAVAVMLMIALFLLIAASSSLSRQRSHR